jgi:hypothetical protein
LWGLVYSIRCTVNGLSYVGQTKFSFEKEVSLKEIQKRSLEPGFIRRWDYHLGCLRGNRHKSKKMQNDWNRFGEESFEFLCVEWVEIHSLQRTGGLSTREQYWQDRLVSEYSRDFEARLGRKIVKSFKIKDLVALTKGNSIIMSKSELEAMKQRLTWLEQKVAVIDKRTRKPRRIAPGQLKIDLQPLE